MKYPNLRYGNNTEFAHYASMAPLDVIARRLRRDPRTIKDWMTGKKRVPWWAPEIMRLQAMEIADRHRQMTGQRLNTRLRDVSTPAPIPSQPERKKTA